MKSIDYFIPLKKKVYATLALRENCPYLEFSGPYFNAFGLSMEIYRVKHLFRTPPVTTTEDNYLNLVNRFNLDKKHYLASQILG